MPTIKPHRFIPRNPGSFIKWLRERKDQTRQQKRNLIKVWLNKKREAAHSCSYYGIIKQGDMRTPQQLRQHNQTLITAYFKNKVRQKVTKV